MRSRSSTPENVEDRATDDLRANVRSDLHLLNQSMQILIIMNGRTLLA